MIIYEQQIIWADEQLTLTNRRALYWKDREALILSDLHLGKAAHFRKNGIPITSEIHLKDLTLLEKLIAHYFPKRIIIVGDLIHVGKNTEVLDFKDFLEKYTVIEFILVRGNHDRLTAQEFDELGLLTVLPHYTLGNITFVHAPLSGSTYQICGHVHPGVSLRLPTQKFVRLPCFVVSPQKIVLPAFSHFTGLDTRFQLEETTQYAILENGIIAIK